MELNEANKIIQELKSLIRRLDPSNNDGLIKKLHDINDVLEEKISMNDKTSLKNIEKISEIQRKSIELSSIVQDIKDIEKTVVQDIKDIGKSNQKNLKTYEEKVNKISLAALTGLKEISDKLGNMKINVDVENLKKELEKTLSAFSVRKMIEIDSQINNKVEEFSKPFEINAEILKNFNAEILKNNQKLEEANKLKKETENNLNEIYNKLNFKLKLITPIIGIAIFIFGLGLGYGACHFQNQKIISNFLNEK